MHTILNISFLLPYDLQRLIERTRQRREILNQRIAGMPEAAPRKRRTPVLESDGSEKILTEVQNNQDGMLNSLNFSFLSLFSVCIV